MPTAPRITIQPKQQQMLAMIKDPRWPVIGIGGGRGGAKSSGVDRCGITLMYERSGLAVCLVMRTWVKQMVPFHLEPIRRDFPWLSSGMTSSPPALLRIGASRLEFKYAENYDAVVEAFRSANYDLIIIDQAEQFTWREIVEIRKAARSKGGQPAKLVLVFNMRGASIQDLRKAFYLKDIPDAHEFTFIKVNPWDNVEWVRAALEERGYSESDYYAWTDEQRKKFAALYGPYTRQLAHDDPVIAQADWEGGWDSLEGAYFANSFDLESTRIGPGLAETLRRPQAAHWTAQDWGKAHWCVTGWFFRQRLSPSEAHELLGWKLVKPIAVSVMYREMVINEMEPPNVAQTIAQRTPKQERERMKAYFLSPEEVTGDPHSVGAQQGRELRAAGMPGPQKADNERKGGYGLLASLFQAAKGQGWGVDKDGNRFQYDDALLISSECPETLAAIPALLRSPKDLDDVMKTDLTSAKLEQDCGDMLRYGMKSMLAPRKKTEADIVLEQILKTEDPAQKLMIAARHEMRKGKTKGYWGERMKRGK